MINRGFRFEDVMRLSSIKRWGVIEMSREQSVAEHSYNVAAIAKSLAQTFNSLCGDSSTIDVQVVLSWALDHDLPELSTGDLPSPLKNRLGSHISTIETEMYPEWGKLRDYMTTSWKLEYATVKLADYIDALQFGHRFCVDLRKESVLKQIDTNLRLTLGGLGIIDVTTVSENGPAKASTIMKGAIGIVWPDLKTL